ncbi:MAG: 4-hydroxybenzoate octaprenyltransferase [Terriglobales bacterium]
MSDSSSAAGPPSSDPSRVVDVRTLAHLIRLFNQSGTLLLLLPTLWSLLLAAQGRPVWSLVAIFVAGSFLMRSAGVVLNDLADRSYDRQVMRTRSRPLASGALGAPEAWLTALGLMTAAAALLLFLNRLTILLSPVAFLLAAAYPYSKRIVAIPQAVLGAAFGWGAVMAWAAARNSLDGPVWLLYAGTVCWAVAYDTIYALQDRDDDARIGVKSSVILFVDWTWLAVGVSLGGMVVCLGLSGWMVGLGPMFYAVLAAIGGFLSWQVQRLRSHVPPERAFAMFKQHVWVGVAVLAAIWLGFV